MGQAEREGAGGEVSGMKLEVRPIIQPEVRDLCQRPYHGHPKGCPNSGSDGCPPGAPMLGEVLDLNAPVYAVVEEFDLSAHVDRMRKKHPHWSDRQLRNCLYWQGGVKKRLRLAAQKVAREHGGVTIMCPEAMGVNVTETLRRAGVELEWPPQRLVRKVALVGIPHPKMMEVVK